METMAEPGLLPQPHHSSHAYLAGAGNPGAPGVHPGFFQGQSLETTSSSPPPPVPVSGDNRQSYLSPVTSSQGYPPFPYKQQLHQTSASMQQAHSVGTMEFPSAYRNVPEGFGRNPDSRTFGFSRSSSFPHSSSPFHPSVQAGLMPGFRDPKQRPPGTSANPDSVQAERDGERKELSAGARRGPQSPFMKEPPEGYRDQQGPSMSDQLGFNPPEKDHEIRADIGKEFLPPDQREKQASRYGAFNGNAAFRDGGDFGPVKSKGQPAFLDNIMGNFRSSPGDIDAEPMAYDAEDFSPREMSGFPGRNIGLKSREPLARSASHDVRSVAWGSDLDLGRDERDADGRPLRSLTLDPSLHRRHPRPELYMVSGYGDRDDVCSQVPDRRLSLPQQDVMAGNRTNSSREQVKGQPDRVMTSPAKPTRRLSDHGQSIKDAESAAIPQQSPNRPVPHNASASAKILPERPSQLTNSSGLYPREGKPESDMTSSETLKSDQAPSLSQVSPRSGNSNIKPTSGSPADMPEFTSPKPGEHTNKASSVGKLGGGEDVDDRNGDPKSYTNGNSVDGDDSSRRLDLQSHSLSGKADNIGNISGNNNDDGDDARFYDNTVNTRDRSPEGDTRKGEGSRDDYRSFIAKRELFSEDEDEEGSQDTGSRRGQYLGDSSPRSMSPPSPDSSMTYPSPYSHPFFSPSRGMNSALPFGSQRGALNHDAGPGFPFGKDFHGRFPMAGMGGAPEMGMGGLTRMGPQRNDSSHHRFMNPMGLLEDENKDIYFCHLCSYSGKTKSDFDAHMSVHFEFNCPHCDYTSRTEGRLKRHIKDFHSDDSSRRSMPGRPKIYRCKQCPFSAKEKDKFWEHARSHIKEDKLLQCPKCSFVTEYKHHLEYHLRNHFGSKPFKCTKCNYSCVNKSMLNSHMKSHTNVYQYRCAECTYATKYCHSLKLHLKKYGHKPATVLNQDGSLPQGLDVDASGLSVATKRGPPRGPRGPRKDKSGSGGGPGGDPYLNQLFGMPPVPMGVPGMGAHTMNPISPMLNGMMPFWPMLPHGPGGMAGHAQAPHHPSPQPGMLPGMGSLPHQMRLPGPDAGMMPPHRINHDGAHPPDFKNSSIPAGMHRGPAIGRPVSNDGEDPRNGGNSEEVSRRESVNMVHGDMNKQDYAACNLCDFIAENTHALCMHYIDVHKEEPGRDFHRDFGMSRDGRERRAAFPFPRDRENDRGRKMMERGGLETDKRRMSEPPTDTVPENDHQYNDLHRRNSLAGLLPKNPDSLRANNNRYGGMEEDNRASWQTGPAFPERERSVRMDVCYTGLKEAPGEEDDTNKALGKDDRDTNILHQMTLKFGNGAPMEREDLARETRSPLVESPGGAASGSEEGGHLTNVHSHRSATDRGRGGRPHKETPLDLTKPKPDSPSDFESNSPAEYGEDAGDKRDFFNENARGGKEDTGKSLSKVTEILLKKRPYPEDFQDEENKSSEMSRIDKGSAIMPRKRSRKGKAYKLDTICLKLQEQQSSPLDSDGNESDMEMGFSGFQPLVPPSDLVEAREVKNNDKHQGKEDVSPRELGGQASGDDPNISIEPPVNADNDGVDSDGTEDYTNDEVKDDDFDDFKEVGEVTRVIARRGEEDNFPPKPLPIEENIEGEEAEPSSFASDRAENVPNAAEVADSSEVGKNKTDEGLDDSEETDFEKLQRSLKLLNSGEDPTDTDIQTEDWRQNSEGIKDVMNESKEYSQLEDSSRKSTGSSNHDGSDIMIKTEESELSKSQEHQHMNTSECLSDKENSDGQSEIPPSSLMTSGDSGIEKRSLSPKDSASTRLEQFSFDSDEEIDQVDLIHTVLENRKKPLPPAVRRGTELAWKLLNDPVNPVTSLPIPVVTSTAPKSASDGEPRDRTQSASPSLPAASASRTSQPRPDSPSGAVPPPLHLAAHPVGQPTPNSPRPMMGPSSSSPNLIRNGVRQHTTAYRQLHPFQQHHPSSHLPQHQHYQQTPPPLPRNHHPLFPPPPHYGHHASLVSSAGPHAMKSPASSASSMPIPLPPTPMAFIPPTNRMDRVPDQTQSPGTQTGPGVMPHVKPQLPISQQQKSELYECTYCDLTFRDCVMYTVHMGYHSNRNPFKCNSCGIICRDKVEFFLHIARSPHA